MKDPKSFDARNNHWYQYGVFLLLLGQLAVIARTIAGNPPVWSINHDKTVALFSLAGVVSLLALFGLKRSIPRAIYWMCAASTTFAATAHLSGYQADVCLIVGGSGLAVLVASFLLGEKGDVDLPGRTIRIKLPWI